MEKLINEHNARATHPGAEKMFTVFEHEMAEYAKGVERIMDNVWNTDDYHIWAAEWMKSCQIPPERIAVIRQEYEALQQVSSDKSL